MKIPLSEVLPGLPVVCNGFPGTVKEVCPWSVNGESAMVEVFVPGGLVCVSASELRRSS